MDRIDGLVIASVTLVRFPLAGNVGRERHLSRRQDGLVQRRPARRKQDVHLGAAPSTDKGAQSGPERHRVAFPEPPGRLRQGEKCVRCGSLDQRKLDLCPRPGSALPWFTPAAQARGYHLGIVDDQGVSRAKTFRQIRNRRVRTPAILIDHHHPRGVARVCRAQCDQSLGKDEIEEIDTHLQPEFGPRDLTLHRCKSATLVPPLHAP
jgi:hypothetical protein